MRLQVALPKHISSEMLFALPFTTFLDLMKLAIYNKKVYMFLESISKNSIVPKIAISNNLVICQQLLIKYLCKDHKRT